MSALIEIIAIVMLVLVTTAVLQCRFAEHRSATPVEQAEIDEHVAWSREMAGMDEAPEIAALGRNPSAE